MNNTELHKELSTQTYLLQFYCFLTRGFLTKDDFAKAFDYGNQNIELLNSIKNSEILSKKKEELSERITQTKTIINNSKIHLKYPQICDDSDIAIYMNQHPQFYQEGIMIYDLRKILDIKDILYNGYFLHDNYLGYPEKDMFAFQVDCLDFLYSSSFFYNEAFDYYYNRKEIKDYSKLDFTKIPPDEFKRIQDREEVIFRTLRESYINMIFFIESFVNSVGFDAFLNDIGRDENENNKLKGITSISKSGYKKYSSFNQKIKDISRIISGNEIDVEEDPFKSYYENNVEIRNQYVHSSPEKGRIKITLNQWKEKCDKLIDDECFQIIETFWKGCYPKKTFPRIIFNN